MIGTPHWIVGRESELRPVYGDFVTFRAILWLLGVFGGFG